MQPPQSEISLNSSVSSFKQEGDLRLLHGTLHIKIVRCDNLRNFDGIRGFKRLGGMVPKFIERDLSDPFVSVRGGDHRFAKTSMKSNDLNPVWNEEFYASVCHYLSGLRFEVKDKDFGITSELMGSHFLPVDRLLRFDAYDDDDCGGGGGGGGGGLGRPKRVALHEVVHLDGKKSHGTLEYYVEYIPKEVLAEAPEVPGVYFDVREGNSVNLYVNADDGAPGLPEVRYGGPRDDERVWTPRRLWRDVFDAICGARHLIYVTGWALDTTQSLLRGEERDAVVNYGRYSPVLGELLVQKAREGVAVNMLVWDDSTSNPRFGMPGMMGTHDEESRVFFRGTGVTFRLASMVGDSTNSIHERAGKFVMFTHHQKLVVVDVPRDDGSGGREPLAFVGGIDLTDGRWDNHTHPLFRTLGTCHRGDAYGKCFPVDCANVGPRQPWRDIHSSVRGPGVLDVLENFKERWYKQASDAVGELLELHRIGLADPPARRSDDGGWHTQLFRSIDERTAYFEKSKLQEFDAHQFEDSFSVPSGGRRGSGTGGGGGRGSLRRTGKRFVEKAREMEYLRNLVERAETKLETFTQKRTESAGLGGEVVFGRTLQLKKGRNVDASIHTAMVHHIRRARHTVYVESQYFLGSSHLWIKDRRTKCGNLVPSEITIKICEKIAAGERFAAYIVLPMWPEGIPTSGAVQAILYWQRRTMEAMYKRVGEALAAKRSAMGPNRLAQDHPRDYLNFYCLATRETPMGSTASAPPRPGTAEETLSRTRRHQIYVHSKLMIVDDAVALVGSANINQRSLDGTRDSEIVMGAYQPAHMATAESIPHGDVHGFRMHCWATATGTMEDAFRDPSGLGCVRRVNEIAEENWSTYVGEECREMGSYLLPYPIAVDRDGRISVRPELQDGCFPDTKAKVLGTKSMAIPEILCT